MNHWDVFDWLISPLKTEELYVGSAEGIPENLSGRQLVDFISNKNRGEFKANKIVPLCLLQTEGFDEFNALIEEWLGTGIKAEE